MLFTAFLIFCFLGKTKQGYYVQSDSQEIKQYGKVTFSIAYREEKASFEYIPYRFLPVLPRITENSTVSFFLGIPSNFMVRLCDVNRATNEIHQHTNFYSQYLFSCDANSITLAFVEYIDLHEFYLNIGIDTFFMPAAKLDISFTTDKLNPEYENSHILGPKYNYSSPYILKINPKLYFEGWSFKTAYACKKAIHTCSLFYGSGAYKRYSAKISATMGTLYIESDDHDIIGDSVGWILSRGHETKVIGRKIIPENAIVIERCDRSGITLRHNDAIKYQFSVNMLNDFKFVGPILNCTKDDKICTKVSNNTIFEYGNFNYLKFKNEQLKRIQIAFFVIYGLPNTTYTQEDLVIDYDYILDCFINPAITPKMDVTTEKITESLSTDTKTYEKAEIYTTLPRINVPHTTFVVTEISTHISSRLTEKIVQNLTVAVIETSTTVPNSLSEKIIPITAIAIAEKSTTVPNTLTKKDIPHTFVSVTEMSPSVRNRLIETTSEHKSPNAFVSDNMPVTILGSLTIAANKPRETRKFTAIDSTVTHFLTTNMPLGLLSLNINESESEIVPYTTITTQIVKGSDITPKPDSHKTTTFVIREKTKSKRPKIAGAKIYSLYIIMVVLFILCTLALGLLIIWTFRSRRRQAMFSIITDPL